MKTLKHVSIAVMMIISLLVLMIGLGTTASAETYGDLTYTVADGKIIITDCKETATSVVIPAVIGEYPVTAILVDAFDGCTALTDVYYAGSEEEWVEIEFEFDNEEIRLHYDCADGQSHFSFVITAPTCSENGYTTYSCICGYNYVSDIVDAAHFYESEIIKKATCIEKGDIRYTCKNCDNTYTEEEIIDFDAENHVGDKDVRNKKEAICAQDGYTGDTYCLDCNNIIESGKVISATGKHNYVSAVTKEATCHEEGVKTFICSMCSGFYTEAIDIDSSNHEGGTEVRDAVEETCAEKGYSGNTYCLGCEVVLEYGHDIDATGIHSYEIEVTTPATCVATGVKTYTCSVCEDKKEEIIEIDATNHVGETEIRDAVAEDCGNDGYEGDTYCIDCENKVAEGEVIPATGNHTYESEITKVSTCCETGLRVHTCSVCEDVKEEIIDFDAENHAGEKELRNVAVETCGKDGYTGDECCTGCDAVLEKGEVIPATGNHSYASAVTKDATCCEKGITTYICSVCSDFYTKEIELNSLNHSGGTEIRADKQPTCITEGYTGDKHCLGCDAKLLNGEAIKIDATNHVGKTEVRDAVTETCGKDGYDGDVYCLDCGEKIVTGKVIAATGKHTYDSEITKISTCCVKGERTYICAVCEHTYTEEVEFDATNHAGGTEFRNAIAETCGKDGYEGDIVCLGCENKIGSGEIIKATGVHTCEGEVTKAATCCATGVRTFTCTVCDYTYDESIEIDATNHAGGTEFRNPIAETCGKDGYEGDIHCLGCGIKLGDGAVIEATGNHNYESEVTSAATCCTTGVRTFTCAVCDYTYDETIELDANNHVGETELRDEKEANCIEKGYTGDVCCTSCDAILEAGSITPVETGMHKYSSEVTKASTCCETGVRTYTCQICQDSFAETIDKNPENHGGGTEDRNPKPATCDKVGYTGDVYCKGCNVKISDGSEIEKIAHTETLIKGKAATCSATGLTDGKKCSVCGFVTTSQKIIAKTDHTFGEWIVVNAPTVTEKGTEERACTVCKTKETRTVDKLNYTPGDVNGDGKVNAADARIVLRVSAKLENLEGEYIKAADVNKDDKVNAADARIILRVSAKLESL